LTHFVVIVMRKYSHDPYNFELYHFRVCAFFFDRQCISLNQANGVKRSVGEIKKKWAVLKSSAKIKAAANARQRAATGGGPSTEIELSATDDRIVGMISSVAVSGLACGFDSADAMLSSRK